MKAAQYDGSFDGLLCVVFEAYTRKWFPEVVAGPAVVLPLHVTEVIPVDTALDKAARVYTGLMRKLSEDAMEALLYAWMSEEAGCDALLFRYICKAFATENSVEGNCADPDVLAVTQLAKKVCAERHLMLGFVRFQKTAAGVYFAAIQPRYNVLPLITQHFKDRFGEQPWLIYDVQRRVGVFYDGKEMHDACVDTRLLQKGQLHDSLLAEDELLFQALWHNYFDTIAIAERRNPRLQSTLMPRRFWPYMTEMQDRRAVTKGWERAGSAQQLPS